jgi:hypothetical protein
MTQTHPSELAGSLAASLAGSLAASLRPLLERHLWGGTLGARFWGPKTIGRVVEFVLFFLTVGFQGPQNRLDKVTTHFIEVFFAP